MTQPNTAVQAAAIGLNVVEREAEAYLRGWRGALDWYRQHLKHCLGPENCARLTTNVEKTGRRGVEALAYLYVREDGTMEVLDLKIPGNLGREAATCEHSYIPNISNDHRLCRFCGAEEHHGPEGWVSVE